MEKFRTFGILVVFLATLFVASDTWAIDVVFDFESPTYTVGSLYDLNLDGQDGWIAIGRRNIGRQVLGRRCRGSERDVDPARNQYDEDAGGENCRDRIGFDQVHEVRPNARFAQRSDRHIQIFPSVVLLADCPSSN